MKRTFTCFLPVHGGWGEWSNHWSECSTTCGLGMRTRERECDNPKPKYGGRPCDEQERQQVKYCRERDCDPGLILRLLLLSFYCMFVAAFPLAEFLCFHTGIKMTIAQLAWEKEIVGHSGTWSQMSPSSTHYEKCFLLNFFFFLFLPFLVTEYSASGSGEGWGSGSGSASGSWGESGDWEEHSGKRAWSDDEDLWEK